MAFDDHCVLVAFSPARAAYWPQAAVVGESGIIGVDHGVVMNGLVMT